MMATLLSGGSSLEALSKGCTPSTLAPGENHLSNARTGQQWCLGVVLLEGVVSGAFDVYLIVVW